MKAFAILILSLLVLNACKTKKEASSPSHEGTERGVLPPIERGKEGLEYSPNTLIIMVDEKTGKEPLYKAIKDYGATLKYDYNIIPGVAIIIPEGTTLEQGIAYFKKVKGVVSVSKDRITRLTDPVRPRLEER